MAAFTPPASATHRVLLERSQSRRRLARVKDGDPAIRRLGEPARERRNPRQALQVVECGTLTDEQRSRGRDDVGDLGPRPAPFAVLHPNGKRSDGPFVELPEDFERHLEPGEDALALDQKRPARLHIRRNDRFGGDVAVADVFLERAAHEIAIQPRIERLHRVSFQPWGAAAS